MVCATKFYLCLVTLVLLFDTPNKIKPLIFSDYHAWKTSNYGSSFIQILCKVFTQYGHKMELLQVPETKIF